MSAATTTASGAEAGSSSEFVNIIIGALGAIGTGVAAGKTGIGGSVLGVAGSNATNILTILSAVFSSKGENGETVNTIAEGVNTGQALATVAKGVEEFVTGKQGGAATLGDLVEGIVGYSNFKGDLAKGDGVTWAATKTFMLKKTLGFLAEKVAEFGYNHSTTIKTMADTVGGFAKGEGGHGLPESIKAAATSVLGGASRTTTA